MRKLVFPALAALVFLSACSGSKDAPSAASQEAAPARESLSACVIPAEALVLERFKGDKSVVPNESRTYDVLFTGEDTGESYSVKCITSDSVNILDTVQGARLGGVRRADLEKSNRGSLNAGLLPVGQKVEISKTFAVRGTTRPDGFITNFFAAARFVAPVDGRYCMGITSKFVGKTGKGTTSVAIDDAAWSIWGHPNADGSTFEKLEGVSLKQGEHLIYLKFRESAVSMFEVNPC